VSPLYIVYSLNRRMNVQCLNRPVFFQPMFMYSTQNVNMPFLSFRLLAITASAETRNYSRKNSTNKIASAQFFELQLICIRALKCCMVTEPCKTCELLSRHLFQFRITFRLRENCSLAFGLIVVVNDTWNLVRMWSITIPTRNR
jgi:hypothetical protein